MEQCSFNNCENDSVDVLEVQVHKKGLFVAHLCDYHVYMAYGWTPNDVLDMISKNRIKGEWKALEDANTKS